MFLCRICFVRIKIVCLFTILLVILCYKNIYLTYYISYMFIIYGLFNCMVGSGQFDQIQTI